ncbi:nucleoside ABC transporter ATP-binding protein [Oscillibacter sp. PC13]|uniref:ABC transporter ATP-binding protein n=1 Tax=Oscillibacter sp. PC13 TaxID=1855299 RepID=UPI0008F16AE8|nr:ABC transporter ATP-binding protein [Oscillibacter sp. PC13]SFP26156.1 nucleoside ABC transporter ATP-binding protein [Oscillibacter sp. PC13]
MYLSELLRMEHVSKRFGDFYANRDINLSVRRGEVHTLLGENGAGKSTLMNVLIGLYQPTEGSIYLNGQKVQIDSPAQAVRLGIGMVHQHFMLVEAMTVFENIILGDRNTKGVFIDREARKREILELSERYGLDVELDKPVTEIAVGAQQRVEILKALYRGAELLILDEPSAALTDIEVEGLFKIMNKLTEEGKSIIFISHKMREVMRISDRITILRAGEVITTLERAGTDGQELANLMIGRELTPSHYEKAEASGDPVIALRHVDYQKTSKHNGLNGVSLTVGRGEIVGIAGVDGNGQSQLAQVVTGVLTPDSGEVDMKGTRVAKFTPNGFILENVSHIPEDRNKMGLIGDMSVKDNIVLKSTEAPKFSQAGGLRLKKKEIREYAEQMREKYDIRCTSIEQQSRSLSGGNQQKVILARELESDPDLLVAVHPTRGLDIGATRFVHDTMVEARDKGCGVLLISADFDEILEVSDRIIVMFEGQVMGVFSGKNPPIEEISLAMAGK